MLRSERHDRKATMRSATLMVFSPNGSTPDETSSAPIDLRTEPRDGVTEPALARIEVLGCRCKEGGPAAWTSLFPVVWPVLVRFVNRLYHSLDQQDAEDVAQATLEAAITAIQTYSGRGLFRAWLFGIASQQARTLFRRKSAAKRGLTLLVSMSDSTERRDESAKSPSEATAESDRAAILHRALEQLPEDDRDLVHLYFFGDLTFREIGLVRKMNAKTVCTRLTRAKAKLLNILIQSNLTRADG
jgi:RNA polymerase sigma factor (sigma-70 family)